MREKGTNFHTEKDIREFPTYGVAETAHYLQIPQTTLRSWVVGRRYPTGDGTRFFEPLITLPDPNRPLLSFMNVVEVHVLDAIRQQHQIRVAKIRQALLFGNGISQSGEVDLILSHWSTIQLLEVKLLQVDVTKTDAAGRPKKLSERRMGE
jgi:hypothetical protein